MEFADAITVTNVILLAGLILLACWLLKTSLGRNALADSAPRRNSMLFYVPFIPIFLVNILGVVSVFESMWADWTLGGAIAANVVVFAYVNFGLMLIVVLRRLIETRWPEFALAHSANNPKPIHLYRPFILLSIWFGAVSLPTSIIRQVMGDLPDRQSTMLDNLILCFQETAAVIVIILIAKVTFVSRLKGFGLDVKTVIKDFFAAFVNLLAVWPLITTAIIVTVFLGGLVWGQDYQMQQHEQLKVITEHPQLSLRVLIFITAVVIAPVFEELLFRGLFQTMIRSHIEDRGPRLVTQGAGHDDKVTEIHGAWPAILISSMLFAATHANTGHWPALFVLGVCLGYAYEKSGSLLRPIFIHSLFNAASLTAALSQ
jgi:membrane protease YdiL (CAAX protease family)